jgi:hypothetical protein
MAELAARRCRFLTVLRRDLSRPAFSSRFIHTRAYSYAYSKRRATKLTASRAGNQHGIFAAASITGSIPYLVNPLARLILRRGAPFSLTKIGAMTILASRPAA